jgi:tetratricopeptide (TPR) repeat protein
MPWRVLFLPGILWVVSSCARPHTPDTTEVQRLREVHVVQLPEKQGHTIDAYDAIELFNRGNLALEAEKYNDAIILYLQLQREFPDTQFLAPALYNSGICFDRLGRYEDAVATYRRFIEKFPESDDMKDILFRLSESLEELARWEEMISVLDTLNGHNAQLTPVDRVEIRTRKGAALIELQRPGLARVELEHAIHIFTHDSSISQTAPDYYYAMAQFKLAELTHDEMHQLALPADDSALGEILEKKCQLLLDAQYLYTQVIRIGHPHWSGAAAYRTGALYHHLWQDMLSAPPPAALNETEQEMYTEVLRKRIKILLEKAVKQWRRTLKFARRLNLDSEWVIQTRRDLEEIEALLKIESQVGADLSIE